MAAEGEDNVIRYTFTGEDSEVVPADATHVTVHESVKVIPSRAFYWHRNIEEFQCHDGVETIEEWAFYLCPSLRRVKMPGVKIIEIRAFSDCDALEDVECGKLERIGWGAFYSCSSLRSINLPSVKIVEELAFDSCTGLTDVNFGDKLESIGGQAFYCCVSLERIAIPLNHRIIAADDIFTECRNLKHVDLVGGVLETIAALHLEDWRNDMNAAIDDINQILPKTYAGRYYHNDDYDVGYKTRAVREWMRSVRHKLDDYKDQHRAATRRALAPIRPRRAAASCPARRAALIASTQ
jgi:hypothetical protein